MNFDLAWLFSGLSSVGAGLVEAHAVRGRAGSDACVGHGALRARQRCGAARLSRREAFPRPALSAPAPASPASTKALYFR